MLNIYFLKKKTPFGIIKLDYTEELSVEIDHYKENDYTEVDNKIELFNLKLRDRAVVDCCMEGR